MKKIIGVLAAVGVALALVGCDTVTPTGGSLDLVATWTNVSKQYVDLSTTPAASTKEGTWKSDSITYPTTPQVQVTNGITTTTYGNDDTQTTTTTSNLVIQASGSYVKTTTISTVWTDRAAIPANTATVQSNYPAGGGQLYAGTKTDTTTETVTVTVEGDHYKEVKVTAQTIVYTGKNKLTGVAYASTDNSSTTTTTTTPVYSNGALSYNTADGGTMTQTVFGKTIGAPTNAVRSVTTTTTWAFAKDGTYTATVVVLTDQPAIAAVAATANSAEVLATAAGTTTSTSTITGTYTTQAYNTVNAGIITGNQNQYLAKGARLYMYEQAKTVSQIGTGYLISIDYPETAKTSFNATLTTQTYDVVINKNTLIVDGTKVYTKPATN